VRRDRGVAEDRAYARESGNLHLPPHQPVRVVDDSDGGATGRVPHRGLFPCAERVQSEPAHPQQAGAGHGLGADLPQAVVAVPATGAHARRRDFAQAVPNLAHPAPRPTRTLPQAGGVGGGVNICLACRWSNSSASLAKMRRASGSTTARYTRCTSGGRADQARCSARLSC